MGQAQCYPGHHDSQPNNLQQTQIQVLVHVHVFIYIAILPSNRIRNSLGKVRTNKLTTSEFGQRQTDRQTDIMTTIPSLHMHAKGNNVTLQV